MFEADHRISWPSHWALWPGGLASPYFVNKVRTQFNLRGIWILNRIIGSIVIVVSVVGLVFTLMGESLYYGKVKWKVKNHNSYILS